ncbi:MAG: protein-L-isoaspartate O-methyltransferase [Rhodocyclales bacterium]|nr:protein-L-isoaspartate O-methyltransferase [Rhodocyclales bacterium]
MNIEQARFNMIEQQLRPARVLDADVLEALAVVKREDFVPPAWRHLAFAETELPLGHGAAMFSPLLEARALQALAMRRHENVLEIGAGSGYMAALLGAHADHVYSFEIEPELATLARANLQRASVFNVHVEPGNGLAGLPAHAPFDAIMVSGGVRAVPKILLDQLKPGGRLFAVVGTPPTMQAMLFQRSGEHVRSTALFETEVGFLRGAEPEPDFEF